MPLGIIVAIVMLIVVGLDKRFEWSPNLPLLLGSLWALIPAALVVGLLIIRTALEDRTLLEELEGYHDYAARVRYRLLPGVW